MENQNETQSNKAYEYAMFLLNIRLRTEGELREKLRIKNYELGIITEVINQLTEQHYIDDQRFAEVYLENLKKYKSWGYFGVKKKLMEKKLPTNIIDKVLLEGMSEEDELEIAKRFLKKLEVGIKPRKAGSAPGGNYEEKPQNEITTSSDSYGARQKLAKKLASKGFRTSVISKLVF